MNLSHFSFPRRGGGVMIRVAGFLAAVLLLAAPQAARAASFLSTVPDQTFTVGTAVNLTLPQIKEETIGNCFTEHRTTTYSLSPTLPQGLSFTGGGVRGPSSLLISGTPTQATAETQYTYSSDDPLCYQTATTTFNITVVAASSCSSQSTEDLRDDCAALESLYDNTGGANWKTSTDWKSSNPLGQWYGVSVTDGRVSSVDLHDNQLTGTIPSELNSLAELVKLDLGVNSLSGTIPDLSSLDSLETLFLDGNNLSGEIPDLSELDNLWNIDLRDNSLGGTTTSIGLGSASSKANWVRISNNRLSGTIPDLSLNGNLQVLLLDGNKLSGTLDALASPLRRDALTVLDLSRNNISGTIPDLSSLSIQNLSIAHNKLSGTLDNLTRLGDRPGNRFLGLDLGGNNISGTIPDLSFFTNLGRSLTHTLSLHGNKLSGPLPDLSSFTGITVIDLAENDFTGTIGDLGGSSGDLSNFGRLDVLDVSGNRLTGQIPASSKLPQKLQYFQLNDNSLSGSVPSLSGLTKLKALGLWGNPDLTLTGITLPSGVNRSVIDWAALWTLHYKNNGYGWNSRSKWVGSSPMGEWHGVTTDSNGQVTGLNLRNNNLRSGISGSIAALGSLGTLDLSCNSSLSGELPLGLKNITTLTTVNICSTGMTLPSDQSFTDWKDGGTVTFTDGTCSGAQTCPAPVSQQSSPPPAEEVEEQGGSGQGEGNEGTETESEEEPVVSGDTEGGGCALLSEAGGSKPGAAFGLLLCASALTLAVSRRGRRQSGERRRPA